MDIGRISGRLVAAAFAIAVASPSPGLAQTLEQALGQAYRNNETLNAERASLRAISTGRTSDRKARLNVPSTRPAILFSKLLRTLIDVREALVHNTVEVLARRGSEAQRLMGLRYVFALTIRPLLTVGRRSF